MNNPSMRNYILTNAGSHLTGLKEIDMFLPSHGTLDRLTEVFMPSQLRSLGDLATISAFEFGDVDPNRTDLAMFASERTPNIRRVFAFENSPYAFKVVRGMTDNQLRAGIERMSKIAQDLNDLNLRTENNWLVKVPQTYLGLYVGSFTGENYTVQVMDYIKNRMKVRSVGGYWANDTGIRGEVGRAIESAMPNYIFYYLQDFYAKNMLIDPTPVPEQNAQGTVYIFDQYLD